MTSSSIPGLRLRDMTEADFPILFEIYRDSDVNHMAAFTPEVLDDWAGFQARWTKRLTDDTIDKQVIEVDGQVVGSMSSFEMFDERNVGYSLGKAHWGKGYATEALRLFLQQVTTRPLYARLIKDNVGSRRVLEKNGFVLFGEERGFANARGQEVDELILVLA